MGLHETRFRAGLKEGLTVLAAREDGTNPTGLDFFVVHLKRRSKYTHDGVRGVETLVLPLSGTGLLRSEELELPFDRNSVFTSLPSGLHLPSGEGFKLQRESEEVEVAVVCAANRQPFAARVIAPQDVRVEERGQGQMDGTYHRQVLTLLDKKNAPHSNLVAGEVRNKPGRWSSYPPHHHRQPELYYYRFDKPEGYGHAEVGEQVFKVKTHDITCMARGEDHAQVSAPGYAMYYLWLIRHLPGNAYDTPEFTQEHKWLLKA